MGFYSEIKRNKLLIHITKWMNIKNITLRVKVVCKKANIALTIYM